MSGLSSESRGSGIWALAAAWAVRMRASYSGLSLSFASSTTAVFDPAKPCLSPPPSVNGGTPYMQSNYFVDTV